MKLLTVLFVLWMGDTAISSEKVINCYWGTWANYREGNGRFGPTDIDPSLCTHLSYTFFGITDDGQLKSLDDWLNMDNGLGLIKKAISLKRVNPKLKVLAVVGGWNEGSTKYSVMAADPVKRARFIATSLDFVKQQGFDGMDLDWEYPAQRGGSAEDHINFVTLLREIREAFVPHGLQLSIAVAASADSASISYNIPALVQYVDYINVMTYDFHMALDGYLGFNAPYPEVESSIDYWLQEGAPAEKLVLGIGFYGRTFEMLDNAHMPGWPSNGPGAVGIFTGESGYLGYNEICIKKWEEVTFDNANGVPYAYAGDQWVGYDNVQSIELKMFLLKSKNLGGAMVWSIETDDFRGNCGVKYPLLKTVYRALVQQEPSTPTPTRSSVPTTDPATTRTSPPTITPPPTMKPAPLRTQAPIGTVASTTTPAPLRIQVAIGTAAPTITPAPTTTLAPIRTQATIGTVAPTRVLELSRKTAETLITQPTPINETTTITSFQANSTNEPTIPAPIRNTFGTALPIRDNNEKVCFKDGLFLDTSDCSSYYQCIDGEKYEFQCSQGLYFDVSIGVCNWSELVNCTAY